MIGARWLLLPSVALGLACSRAVPPESRAAPSIPAPTPTSAPAASGDASSALPAAVALDRNFGADGIARVDLSKPVCCCEPSIDAVAFSADGALYMAGTFAFADDATLGGCDAGVVKLRADGTIDASFASGRVARVGRNYGQARGVAVSRDGKLIVAGNYVSRGGAGPKGLEYNESVDVHFAHVGYLHAEYVNLRSHMVGRLTAHGVLDGTFAKQGVYRAAAHIGGGAEGVIAHPDGSATVLGVTRVARIDDQGQLELVRGAAVAMRLDARGALDGSFGKKGMASFEPTGGYAIDSYLGSTRSGAHVFSAASKGEARSLVRVTSELSLDRGYGRDGYLALAGVTADAEPELLLAGTGSVLLMLDQGDSTVVRRFDAQGKPDSSFGRAGSATLGSAHGIYSAVVRDDGSLLCVVESATRSEPDTLTLFDVTGKIRRPIDRLPIGKGDGPYIARLALDPSDRLVVIRVASDSTRLEVSRFVLPSATR